MNEKYVKSPYLSSTKRKEATFFPRIHKAHPGEETHLISYSMGKKGCQKPVFKLKEDPLNDKIRHIEDARVYHSKYYKQLEVEICDMDHKFSREIAEIEHKKTQIENAIKDGQKHNYDNKLSIWEIRNEILELERTLEEERNENAQILYDMGYGSEFEDTLQDEGEEQLEISPLG